LAALIASVLLLCAAKKENLASKDPGTNKHQEKSAHNTEGVQPRQPEPTVSEALLQAEQAALVDALRAIDAQQKITAQQQHPDYEPWYAPEVLAQFGLIVIGGLYTLVTWRQLRQISRSVTSERPYLLVGAIDFGEKEPSYDAKIRPRHVPAPIVTLTNYGRTPAIIIRAQLSFEPSECLDSTITKHENHLRLSRGDLCEEPLYQQGVVSNGIVKFKARTKYIEGFDISREWFTRFSSLEWVLNVYGRVEYRDVFSTGIIYHTDFCWILDVLGLGVEWRVGPLSHNDHT
jgi:hypothetical protein